VLMPYTAELSRPAAVTGSRALHSRTVSPSSCHRFWCLTQQIRLVRPNDCQ
ncbi:hypothetical protein NDU88_007013, partial [Pleurodeles waltl]